MFHTNKMQVYYSNAITNLNIRQQIQKFKATNSELAHQFNTSEQTGEI